MASKYGDWTRGEEEALLNILGGVEIARNILKGVAKVVIEVISHLVGTSKQIVNYDRSIKDSVKAGKYDWTNDNITDANFPSKEKGEREVEFGVFHFNKTMMSDDVIAKMKLEGFRPATMKEELAYGEKNPEEQRKYPLVALGSVASLVGSRQVGCLYESSSGRRANLNYYVSVWRGRFRFLGVRV